MAFEDLRRDVLLSWRRIRRAPGPTMFAVVTLAVGIGITVATYSVVDEALWKPLGIVAEDRLGLLGRDNTIQPGSSPISRADYLGLLAAPNAFAGVAAWAPFTTTLAGRGRGAVVGGEAVSGSYFAAMGLQPVAGRLLGVDDDRAGAAPVVVLSYRTWRDQFDRDPAVVGSVVRLTTRPFRVVGVTPAEFRGVHPAGFMGAAAWIPLARVADIDPSQPGPSAAAGTVTIGVRLGAGQSWTAAAAEMAAIGARLDVSAPQPLLHVSGAPPQPALRSWTLAHVSDDQVINNRDAMGRLIVALPGLVMLIACTNLANLVLSRGLGRRHEFGVRRALGASRWRLMREPLVEQTVVAVAGGALGLAVAAALVNGAAQIARTELSPFLHDAPFDWTLDGRVLTFTAVAVILCIVVAGLVPALHLTRDSLRAVIDQGGPVSTPKWRGRANLIAVQVGLSVGLFMIALVFVHSLFGDPLLQHNLLKSPPGANRVAVAAIPFRVQGIDEVGRLARIHAVLDDLGRDPHVVTAAASSKQPYVNGMGLGNFIAASMHRPGDPPDRGDESPMSAVSSDYFRIIGKTLTFGRTFAAADTAGEPSVVIVNEGLALDVFGVRDATGRAVVLEVRDFRATPPPMSGQRLRLDLVPATPRNATIVGIVEGAERSNQRIGQHVGELYVPLDQQPGQDMAILARGRESEAAPVETLRAALEKADPELAVDFVSTGSVLADGPAAFGGYVVATLLLLAFVALGLAMAGLYGVLSHVVGRRTREMGIRAALGATSGRIMRLVILDGARPLAEGLFIGVATAAVVRALAVRTLTAYTVAGFDGLACILAAVLVAVAGALACYLPARRAAAVDPNVALRHL